MNVAVTDASAVMLTVQVAVPEHAPDQPAKAEPEPAVAVNVTEVAPEKLALHVCPQLIPAGALAMVPAPAPPVATVSWKVEAGGGTTLCVPPQPQTTSSIAKHAPLAKRPRL